MQQYLFIAANLYVGITISSQTTLAISETTSRTYQNCTRDINRMVNEYNTTEAQATQDYYWDKLTGVAVELTIINTQTPGSSYATTRALHWMLSDSAAWVIPEFPNLSILLVFLLAIPIVAAIIRRNHSKRLASKVKSP
jgi:hypothetical protein